MAEIPKPADLIKMDLDKKGFTFWILIFGVIITIISIIYNPDFVLLGILISLYGAIGNLIETLIDRLIFRKMKSMVKDKEDPNIYWHEISEGYQYLRLIVQLVLISILIILVYKNVEFDC